MGRWAGWGAGPAGAGAAGGPSRGFLAAACVGSGGLAVAGAFDGKWPGAVLAAAAAIYFGLRAFAGLGGARG